MSKLILGVDEAGRGAVAGPMVLSAVVVEKNKRRKLKGLGVKDSKELTRDVREKMEPKIKELAEDFATVKVPAKSIDEMRQRKSLNRIELEKIAEMVNALRPDKAIIDATEVKTGKIERELAAEIEDGLSDEVEIKAENYADENYPVVSAASILAKVLRDNSVSSLERELDEEIGNGYPSDERTKNFLRRCLDGSGTFPDCVRESWVTVERMLEERGQGDLSDFCGVED